MPSLSFEPAQLLQVKFEAVRGRPYSDRISLVLAFRLLGITSPGLDVFAVLDELDYMEGFASGSKTKSETQFKRAPLAPFWHKHFASARHILPNIMIRWNVQHGGNKDFDELLNRIATAFGNDPEAWQKHLAHALTVGAVEDRAKRGFTGDWIIYGKHEGRNYYFDLASHEEGESQNADALYGKLKSGCAAEFPFLFTTLRDV
jgi:hypothetical protein